MSAVALAKAHLSSRFIPLRSWHERVNRQTSCRLRSLRNMFESGCKHFQKAESTARKEGWWATVCSYVQLLSSHKRLRRMTGRDSPKTESGSH